jgi:hypothetical protein
MRMLIPLRELLLETVEMLDLPAAIASTIYTQVHEDNASALLLANSQHLNNRNKYLSAKLHHLSAQRSSCWLTRLLKGSLERSSSAFVF